MSIPSTSVSGERRAHLRVWLSLAVRCGLVLVALAILYVLAGMIALAYGPYRYQYMDPYELCVVSKVSWPGSVADDASAPSWEIPAAAFNSLVAVSFLIWTFWLTHGRKVSARAWKRRVLVALPTWMLWSIALCVLYQTMVPPYSFFIMEYF